MTDKMTDAWVRDLYYETARSEFWTDGCQAIHQTDRDANRPRQAVEGNERMGTP